MERRTETSQLTGDHRDAKEQVPAWMMDDGLSLHPLYVDIDNDIYIYVCIVLVLF